MEPDINSCKQYNPDKLVSLVNSVDPDQLASLAYYIDPDELASEETS